MAEKAEAKAAPQAQQPSSGTGTDTGGVSSSERAVSAFVGYSCGAARTLALALALTPNPNPNP